MTTLPAIPPGWLGTIEQARELQMHPESLLRKRRFGELPTESYTRIGKDWFFNPEALREMVAADHDAS